MRRAKGYQPAIALSLTVSGIGVISGCALGQIGGEIEGVEEEVEPTGIGECIDRRTTAWRADDSFEGGASSTELASIVAGTHQAELVWEPGGLSDGAVVTPRAGIGLITIEVEPFLETAVLVERELKSPPGMDSDVSLDMLRCGPEIRFDANVTIRTDNGAFDDTFRATMSASSRHSLTTSISFTPGKLNGSLKVETAGGGDVADGVIDLNFIQGSFGALIQGQETKAHRPISSAATVHYGAVPSGSCNGREVRVPDENDWARTLSASLLSWTDFPLDWGEGGETNLKLEPSLDSVCFGASELTGDFVSARVMARVGSDDGRVDGTWLLEAKAPIEADGKLGRIAVQNEVELVAVEGFPESSGIGGLDFELSLGTEVGFRFSYGGVAEAAAAPEGALEIFRRSRCVPATACVDELQLIESFEF